ncbi:MocR-like pyridoxine biosynthesis transcription factor PdxR [Bacillus pseudomycoides]|uniref:MocR-like pyridoxine biosynthesis transcription factor PdxR n=1 Tax=Bacillus pseudomycoides TaxID=64104 RepID=UPI000BEBFEFC|nr:PLP-dependent aminotransferase family protein [Bacillus pseudomycoides]MED4651922.1 PLP-dependent aminotransferase family protein [Bacillus pseudomycoides]PEE03303.1 GntR family transcriptional regulator [Bacillus pseudomycoides]PEM65592.1 GntR family transcriptional regulator [Bacillus pseudomycoides]PHC90250.1 GntR family transcriptional regulator [Bacillus pseudomycoides]
MEWKLDNDSKIPIYQQVVDFIERRIMYGELPPGSFLPSERKLAIQLNVNRSTVTTAYNELRAMGIVDSTTGRGTRVSTHMWGVSPTLTPNWRGFVEGGTFLPNLPLLRHIREQVQQNENIIDFANGELGCNLFPHEQLQSILREQPLTQSLSYDHPLGYLPLRQAAAKYMRDYLKIEATEQSIMITSGAQQALHLIVQCLLNPGDAVAFESPSHCYSLPLFQSAGIRIFPLPVDEHGVNPEDVHELYRKHRIKMIFLNPNFQNPTGTMLHPNRRKKLLSLCADLRIPIVEDDPSSLLTLENKQPCPTLKSIDENGTVIYVHSLSKMIAPGLRIGWLVAPQSVVERLSDARHQMELGLSIFPQWLMQQFFETVPFDTHITQLRNQLAQKRDVIVDALNYYLQDTISFSNPNGGIYIWGKLKEPINEKQLIMQSLKQQVAFMPGSIFGAKDGYIRLSYGKVHINQIEDGISRLHTAIELCQK